MTEVVVKSSKTYKILIGRGILPACGEKIRTVCGGARAAIVCGDTVSGLYAPEAARSLKAAGYAVNIFTYPHGEASKTPATYIDLLNHLAENKMSREDVVVALGGGVTGDMAGFAAATYMRGIKYVQIPTTLLAMVDSSVGGKTAIDLPAGKNLAGAFHQPELVLCDMDALNTLPAGIFADGCGEVVKYAVLKDPELLDLIKNLGENLEEIITRCVVIKRDLVNADEFDRGSRVHLNLGHSVGHAVEKLSDYSLSHGRAVSIGLSVILRAAERTGECDRETVTAVTAALEALDLPTSTDLSPDTLVEAMLSDKKREGEAIKLVIPRALGDCFIKSLPTSELCRFIAGGLRE